MTTVVQKNQPVAQRKLNKLFLFIVLFPTIFSIVYFSFFASSVYVAKSSFVVHSTRRGSTSLLGALLKGSGFGSAQDDIYMVRDFIMSRDALQGLDGALHVQGMYSKHTIDFLSRYSILFGSNNLEDFFDYYKDRIVNVRIDPSSSIATLTVSAFSPQEAYNINMKLLSLSERLINKLNAREQQDVLSLSVQEVNDAEKKAKKAALDLAEYRNEKGVIDPERQSAISAQGIAKLEEDLVNNKMEIAQVEKVSRINPMLSTLRQRARILEKSIKEQESYIAGGKGSLASVAKKYTQLKLQREFTDKMLASAMNNLEQARNEAENKQFYLERIVQPIVPDAPKYPKRLRDIFVTLIVSLIVWGILSLIFAGIKEHHE